MPPSPDPELRALLLEVGKVAVLPLVSAGATHWWYTRTRKNLEGLEVSVWPWSARIYPDAPARPDNPPPERAAADAGEGGPNPPGDPASKIPALQFRFINKTNEVVILHHCFISGATKRFKPHPASEKDVGTGRFELKFRAPGSQEYRDREVILHTNCTACSTIALREVWDKETHPDPRRSLLLAWRKVPQLFFINYQAVVGKNSYRIKTPF